MADGTEYQAKLERVLMDYQPVRSSILHAPETLPHSPHVNLLDAEICLSRSTAREEDHSGPAKAVGSSATSAAYAQRTAVCADKGALAQTLYLRIDTFAGPPVGEALRQQIQALTSQSKPEGAGQCRPLSAVVLDVRGNSGGRLTQADEAAAAVLSIPSALPPSCVVMVDALTASAAEALILRLFEAKSRGQLAHVRVVGVRGATKTFGKGVSQQAFELSDGSAVMITVSSWAPEGFDGISVDETLSEGDTDDAIRLCTQRALQLLRCRVR